MTPKEFRKAHPEKWAKLVPAWANLSHISDRSASNNLIENDMGDLHLLKKDEKWSLYQAGELVFTYDEDQKDDWW